MEATLGRSPVPDSPAAVHDGARLVSAWVRADQAELLEYLTFRSQQGLTTSDLIIQALDLLRDHHCDGVQALSPLKKDWRYTQANSIGKDSFYLDWAGLPVGVLTRIFEALEATADPVCYAQARLACTSWVKPSAWAVSTLRPNRKFMLEGWHQMFTKLRHLDLTDHLTFSASDMALLPHLAQLTSLTLNGCAALSGSTDSQVMEPLQRMPQLQTLGFGGFNLGLFGRHLSCLSGLTSLDLPICKTSGLQTVEDIQTSLHPLSSLQTLKLCGWSRQRAPEKEGAFAALQSLPHLSSLCIWGSWTMTASALLKLQGITALASLDVRGTDITNEGLAAIGTLTGLKSLALLGCLTYVVGEPELSSFSNLQELEHLDLGHHNTGRRPVSDESLLQLQAIPKLRSLGLEGTMVTPEGVGALLAHTGLTSLEFSSEEGQTEACLPTLARLTGLQSLTLLELSTTVTDVQLGSLVALQGLRALELKSTRAILSEITDSGLTLALAGLSSLRRLSLPEMSSVTIEGYVCALCPLQNLARLSLRTKETLLRDVLHQELSWVEKLVVTGDV